MRYFLKIAYNGRNYHGWQIQKNAISIQEVVTNCLRKKLGIPDLKVIGCGRTDTGVHAKEFFLHFDLPFQPNKNFIFELNSFLPEDIAVFNLIAVKPDAHARFDAIERTYQYFVHVEKDPFLLDRSLYVYEAIDFQKMNQACDYLLEFMDFTSFSKLHTDVITNNCKITAAKWEQREHQLVFSISADRFLRNMVRAVVGTLLDIGLGKNTPEHMKAVIEAKDRSAAGQSVPAHALFLTDVKYPYI